MSTHALPQKFVYIVSSCIALCVVLCCLMLPCLVVLSCLVACCVVMCCLNRSPTNASSSFFVFHFAQQLMARPGLVRQGVVGCILEQKTMERERGRRLEGGGGGGYRQPNASDFCCCCPFLIYHLSNSHIYPASLTAYSLVLSDPDPEEEVANGQERRNSSHEPVEVIRFL